MNGPYEYKERPELIEMCLNCEKENCPGYCEEYYERSNRRGVRLYAAWGEKHTLTEWARMFGIKRKTLHERIYRGGMTIERALTKPVKGSRAPAYIEIGSKRLTVREWANETGVPMRAIYARLARGYSPAEAVGLMPNERLRLKRKEG